MATFKKIISFFAIIAFGVFIFYQISTKSKKNPGFDDKSTWSEHDGKLKVLEQKMKDVSAEIKAHMGQGKCEYDYECRVVGLGAKTCDGYSNFLIYSTKDTEEAQLLGMVEEFNKANEEFNHHSINVQGCGEKAKTPTCHNNQCTVSR